jgi:hypothetical protein
MIMDKETVLLMGVEDMILSVADEQQEMSRSDFQGRCTVVAKDIIKAIRADVVNELEEVREGIETDRFTLENVDRLLRRIS